MQQLLPACMALCLFISACQPRDNTEAIKSVNRCLEQTNELLLNNNRLICMALEEKVKDPQTQAKALIWEPKAHKIRELTAGMIKHIDSLKSGLSEGGNTNSKANDQSLDKRIGELYDKLISYKIRTIALFDTAEFADNPFLQQQITKDVLKFEKETAFGLGIAADSAAVNEVDAATAWAKRHTNNSNPLLGLAILSRLQNDILVTENRLLTYCNNKTASLIHENLSFQPLAVLNHSYVKSGERIEVTAGVGTFSFSVGTITIKGKKVPVGDNGMATYRFVATGKPGRYTVPLTIEFSHYDGTRGIVNKQLGYTVEK